MSYQIHCPNCSTAIPPENINVQKTIAACPECGAVFNFEDNVPSIQKIKRRKMKKPDYIKQYDSDTNLKLEMPLLISPSYKALTLLLAAIMAGLYGLVGYNTWIDSDITGLVVSSALFLPFILASLAMFFAKQSITANSEELRHDVQLVNIPLYKRSMDASDVVDVSAEEMTMTRESVAQARYNLYADKYDQRQDMFMQNIPEEMATYSQQALSNFMRSDDSDNDNLRLRDDVNDDNHNIVYEEELSGNKREMQSD